MHVETLIHSNAVLLYIGQILYAEQPTSFRTHVSLLMEKFTSQHGKDKQISEI
jgi:hypothetical protein